MQQRRYMVDRRGIDAKIHRSRECLESLRSDTTAFCEYRRQWRTLRMESGLSNPALRRFDTRESDPGYVPIDFPIRVGEIAYNLRSALDHVVHALVLDNNEEPSKQNEFPIFNEEADYRRDAPRKLKGIAKDRCDLIESFQPFQGGIGRHLWMLHIICNVDKHRHLNVVNTHTLESAQFKEGIESPGLPSRITGGTALYYDVQRTEHEDKVESHVVADVCFRDKEIENASPGYGTTSETEFRRPPVIPVLSGCLSAVTIVAEYLLSARQLPPAMLQHMEHMGVLEPSGPKRRGLLARLLK